MNTPNALGFIIVGLLMEALHFLPSINDVRELWLLVMGAVLMAIGFLVLAQAAWLKVAPRVHAFSVSLAQRRAEAARGASPAGRRAPV
jgi:sulfite exporter TauE/SafE